MATRSGKTNTIQPVTGAVSPRVRLFRNAGLASVWDWSDAAIDDLGGTPIARSIDCGIDVTATVSLPVDIALAVDGAYALPVDTRIATTSAIGISHDERLSIYEVWAFAKDCDLHAITLGAAEVILDERIGVTNASVRSFDIDAQIMNLLSKHLDFSLRLHAYWTLDGDVMISVPDPILLTADTCVAVSGAILVKIDQAIAVSGSAQRLADCLQSICGATSRQAEMRIIVGERIGLKTDSAWRVGNLIAACSDIGARVACLMTLEPDIEIRTTIRLAPDTDLYQRVFAVILREDHIIGI